MGFKDDITTRRLIVEKLIKEPAIWSPFMTIGPSFLFIGLSIQALSHYRENPLGVLLTLTGAISKLIGGLFFPEYRIIYLLGYTVFAVGLLLIAFKKRNIT